MELRFRRGVKRRPSTAHQSNEARIDRFDIHPPETRFNPGEFSLLLFTLGGDYRHASIDYCLMNENKTEGVESIMLLLRSALSTLQLPVQQLSLHHDPPPPLSLCALPVVPTPSSLIDDCVLSLRLSVSGW